MADLIYKIEFLSDWHCGTGLTSGSDVDLLVIKDENGLPFVPGKTLKGLLKEAAKTIKEYDSTIEKWDEFIKSIFGIETEKGSNITEEGKCYFSNAVLSEKLQKDLINTPKLKETLYRKIASTAIDDNGTAKKHSLRKIEVTIPLEMYGKISEFDKQYKDMMNKCFNYTKRLGTTRNRGLGRCIITIYEVK